VIRIRPRTWVSLCLICLSLFPVRAVLAQADGAPVVEAMWHEVRFGESLQFHLTVSSSADITSAVLTYVTTHNQAMTVEPLDLTPAPRVELSYEVDLAHNPLKPFVEIRYLWMVSDANGQQLTVEHDPFFYEDNRFGEWQSLAGQRVAVHWYDGDAAFGGLALGVAEQAVDRMREMIDPALAPSEPFDLYLYASEADLVPALPATGREWVVGHAYPELRVALAVVPPGSESASTMRRLIPHELTHLLLYEALGSRYRRLPSWLNEGLAVVSEQVPDPDEELVLGRALQSGQLLSLESLCYSFPRQGDQARLAYAQSSSVVRFIQGNYGHAAVGRLVDSYGGGLSCGAGVRKVLGVSLDSLESQWRESLGVRPQGAIVVRQAMPWLLLVLVSLPLLLLAAQPLAVRRTGQRRERWL